MSGVIMIRGSLDETDVPILSHLLDQANITYDIRMAQATIVVSGSNDEIIRAKELLSRNGFDLI